MSIRSFAAVAALAIAIPAQAVIVTSSPGAPDPGVPAGQTVIADFDTPLAAGIIQTSVGSVITAAGNISGVRAAPAGTPDGGVYQSIGTGGSTVFDFAGYKGGKPLTSFSFYWGSVDSYNHVDFLKADGTVVFNLNGNNLPQFDGNQTAANSNRRIFASFLPLEAITKIRFRSDGNAFEYDTISVNSAVPEPSTWAMMVIGFGLVGFATRRRSNLVAA